MSKTLIEVLQESGINLIESSGGRRVAVCPFHTGDNDPSFTIYPNNTYFCFGCEVWGDVVKFLIDYKDMSYKEALEYIGVDPEIKRADKAKVIKVKNTVETWKFLWDVASEYHKFLLRTRGALNYLKSRGLTDETIQKYKIGFTDGQALNLKYAWEYNLGTEVGLITKDGFEALSHRITIPNLLSKNECDFIVGRTVTTDKIKYLGLRMPKPIHGFYEVRRSPIIFLAEGQFDMLILKQWGYPAAVLGGSHLSKQHTSLLYGKHIVVVPDNDSAGISLAESLRNKLPNITVLNYNHLGVKDVAELAQNEGGQGKFEQIVKEQASWISYISRKTLIQWFPHLATEVYSPLTLKHLV